MKLEDYTDEYVLSEIQKLKYTYGLNSVIRYNLARDEVYQTQSVAEHVCNTLFLAHYFRPLEDPESEMNFEKVIKLIMMHDMGEIETGDVITVAKDSGHDELEKQAIATVMRKSPDFVRNEIQELYTEMEHPQTAEGRFAKAMDKLEGQIFWIEREGVEMVAHIDKEAGLDISVVHPIMMNKIYALLDEYNMPYVRRFMEVIDQEKRKTGLI
jgi:5'-deoxynucleotidase YfbR-like HD superfamily hydrolase